MGYHRAGFEVVGVDIEPQPNYPFTFTQGDALTVETDDFDAIHASPPCQAFTVYRNNGSAQDALNLIPETRELLEASGLPYVIENVPGAPLENYVQLCGTSFMELEVRRHRWFEANFPILVPQCEHGRLTERKYPGSSNRPNGRTVCNVGEYRVPLSLQHAAMGITWMTLPELSQAIPPAFTEMIGVQLLSSFPSPSTRTPAERASSSS